MVCRGVSGCSFLGREQFPFRDTRNLAENGVSLHGTSVEWQFPVRDTGNFAEKDVSLHRTSVFLYPAVAIQVFPLERVCRCTEPQKERRFPSAIHGILRKRVCRCIVLLFFLYPAVAIQVFPLEMVCRCMEPQKERRFPSAIHGILRKRVCRCTESQKERRFLFAIQEILRKRVCRGMEPRHETSAQNLCSEQRHGLEGKVRFAFCCRRERVRNCF